MTSQPVSPSTPSSGPPTLASAVTPQRAWREAGLAFCVVGALVAGLVRINITLPWVGHLGSALVSVLFLYVPLYIAQRRGEDLRDHGFRCEPVGKGLAITA
ncbi:MAG TPA: hypothetical protein VFT22_03230, partial [Kofleriaceae bacterium]|nr:hypothetical protein [Kofleriaceae bacterium]